MTWLDNIPEAVMCSILCEWCNLVGLSNFDSGMCERNFLYRLYSRKQFNVTATYFNFVWCTMKSLKISKIFAYSWLTNYHKIPTAACLTLKIISCVVSSKKGLDCIYDFINSCVQLSGIAISGYDDSFDFQKVKPHIWERLTNFESNFGLCIQKFTSFLIQDCKQLTSLKYKNCADDSEPKLIEIIQNNSNLKTLWVHTDSSTIGTSLLNILSERLSQLTIISCIDSSNLPVRALVDFIVTAQPSMKRLEFKSLSNYGFNYFYGRGTSPFYYETLKQSVHLNLDYLCNEMRTTEDVLYIFLHLTTLDHIAITGDFQNLLSDEVFQLIASKNNQLSRLTVRNCGEEYDTVDKVKHFFTASDECFEQKDKDKTTESENISFFVFKC